VIDAKWTKIIADLIQEKYMKQLFIFSFVFLYACSVQLVKSTNDDPENYILWDESRPLTWEDFQGTPLDQSEALASEIIIFNPSSYEGRPLFLPAQFEAKTLFDKKKSWVNEKYASELLLEYNQVVFNLYEVYTRKLKKAMVDTSFGMSNPIDIYHNIAMRNNETLMDEISKFREESNLGRNKDAVEKWFKDVNSQLNNLVDYQ
jgi:hypothetical protein